MGTNLEKFVRSKRKFHYPVRMRVAVIFFSPFFPVVLDMLGCGAPNSGCFTPKLIQLRCSQRVLTNSTKAP